MWDAPQICRPRTQLGVFEGGTASTALPYERMFEELSERQLKQLETVWNTALKSVHWRETLRNEISRALATGCTLEHLAAVTGFDQETIERLRREPRNDFNGRHPTDP